MIIDENAGTPTGLEATAASWTLQRLEQRRVRYGDLVPCRNAFIDTRNPGSEDKENFTIVGPGVSENPEQFVHISEPHGFNIGAARQPPNCINSQHSHETAEVFVVHSGDWTLNFGEHGELKLPAGPGAVASIPTNLFRGFSNVGAEEGFLWVALGQDDPGRVLWAPQVFDMASKFGLVLMADGSLVDTARGDAAPPQGDIMPRTSPTQVAALATPEPERLRKCIIAADDMARQPTGLLRDAAGVDERLLIGPGAQIDWPHGFTLSRVTFAASAEVPPYAHEQKEVWFVHSGDLACVAAGGEVELSAGDTMSVPERLPRGWRATAETIAFVVRGGDTLPVVE
jgi:mannose-6-phosphate isomerase-like protein (cupin superfamily)